MDTITNETPVGAEGATSSPDTASTDTQPTESTDSVSDGKIEDVEEAPTLLAGKYKSPEELEKAYTELQSKLGEVGQKSELVNLLEKQTGMNAQQIKEHLSQLQYQQTIEQYQENPVPFLAQKVAQLEQERLVERQEAELDKFLNSEDGKPYQDLRQEIFEDKQYNPRFQNQSFADIARERYGKVRAQGQQDAYKKIEMKQMTQATGASKGAPKRGLTPEDMDKMTASELEAILPHADTSQRLY